jgi:hypothetical protein
LVSNQELILAALAPAFALAAGAPTHALAQAAPSNITVTATPRPTGGPSSVSEIVVTARRLNEARASIQPQIGASVYTVTAQAIQTMPGGDNTQLNQVVLQSPGVAQDSFGQLHVRGEHNGLQFRLDGVILPEGLSVFSQALSPRLAQQVRLITGSLPAQYGLRSAGIIDITSKNGLSNGGPVSSSGRPATSATASASNRRTVVRRPCTTTPTSTRRSVICRIFLTRTIGCH